MFGPKTIWSPHPSLFFELNFDGSKLSNGSAAFRVIIRNADSNVVLAGAQALGDSVSILQASAWGLWAGIRGALSEGISNILIEGDNLAVVNSVNTVWNPP